MDRQSFQGGFEAYLQSVPGQSLCSVTVVLSNNSEARQGAALLDLRWLDEDGSMITETHLRMDPLRLGRQDAKNLSLPIKCEQISQLFIRSAKWQLFQGWDVKGSPYTRIGGVDGTRWRFNWDSERGVRAAVLADM